MPIQDLVRDPARQFPDVAGAETLTSLRVWFCKYRTVGPVAAFANLRTLVVAGYPDSDFVPLSELRRLEYLSVLDFAKVADLSPLADLNQLRVLRLHSPPSWDSSGRVIEVQSLAPLARLPRLEHLELFGVRPTDKSLAPLEAAPRLRTLRVSKYPKSEVARYRSAVAVTDEFAPSPPVPEWD